MSTANMAATYADAPRRAAGLRLRLPGNAGRGGRPLPAMQLTMFGYALLPLCAAAILQPTWQLNLVLLAGAFGAATPLVIGGYGLPPGVIPACLFLAYVALQFFLGARFPAADRAWRTLEPFMLMAAYALVTAILVPRLFAGSFTVWPQKLAPPYDIAVPLAPGGGNVTQSFYLLIDTALVAGCALFFARRGFDVTRVLRAYLGAGYVVVAICGWQLVHKLTGAWFPEAFLYSNPGWVIFPGQTIGLVPRINGPFSEPAALAFYLSGTIFCCTWLVLRGFRNPMAAGLLPLALIALLCSTSTTGFTVLGIGIAGLAVYALALAPRRLAGRILLYGLPVAALAIVIAVGLSTLSTRIEESLAMVARMSLNKAEGDSFTNRTRWDIDSLAVLWPSYGLGAGWGSVRASSLIPGLLGNLGIYGCALLAWFVVRVARQVQRARRLSTNVKMLMGLEGLSAAILGQIVAAAVSAPAINGLDFHVLVGVLIAVAARAEHQAGQERAVLRLRHPVPPRDLPSGDAGHVA